MFVLFQPMKMARTVRCAIMSMVGRPHRQADTPRYTRVGSERSLRPGCMLSSDGHRSAYTAPRIFGPHMTLAHIKCRRSIGKDVVYGLFNVAIPYEYRVEEGPQSDTSYIRVADFEPILVYQSPARCAANWRKP
nr:hypothetical protein [Veillonella denticariosi]